MLLESAENVVQSLVQNGDGRVDLPKVTSRPSLPTFLDHRSFRLFAGGQDFFLSTAYLGRHQPSCEPISSPYFPAELMREDHRPRLAAILCHSKQIADLLRFAVPSKALAELRSCAGHSTGDLQSMDGQRRMSGNAGRL